MSIETQPEVRGSLENAISQHYIASGCILNASNQLLVERPRTRPFYTSANLEIPSFRISHGLHEWALGEMLCYELQDRGFGKITHSEKPFYICRTAFENNGNQSSDGITIENRLFYQGFASEDTDCPMGYNWMDLEAVYDMPITHWVDSCVYDAIRFNKQIKHAEGNGHDTDAPTYEVRRLGLGLILSGRLQTIPPDPITAHYDPRNDAN